MLIIRILKFYILIIFIFFTLSSGVAGTIPEHKGDTSAYIQQMIDSADVDLREGRFNRSFEILGDMHPMAIQISDTTALIDIYKNLGILYGKFGQDSLALAHMRKRLAITGEYYDTSNNKSDHLISAYQVMSAQLTVMQQYDAALQYLDSCYMLLPKNKKLDYVDALYGWIYSQKGDYLKARKYLKENPHFLAKTTKNYQATFYYRLADLKSGLNDPDSARYYYEKSLNIIDSFGIHPMLKPEVLEKLANSYHKANNKSKAFEYMQKAKTFSDSLFNIQSSDIKNLFELKSKYRDDLSKKEATILTQNRIIELKDQAGFRLKLIIGILILLAVIAFISFKMRFRMNKLLYEQTLTQEKNDAILETKNKETAVHALQLIEKERVIKELLETIKETDPKKFKILNQHYKQNSQKLWDDFHARFTQINNKFYERLLELNPAFTPTELKHCSLIKLNFDSKEMAQILGISQNSVHMSRSRIRKKLNMKREDSLSNYIAGI